MSEVVNDLADALERRESFFGEAVPTQAYAKVGIMGGEGDGKTHTAITMAIGLHSELKARGLPEGNHPIAFLESSEFGLDFHIHRIKEVTGFNPLHRKTKAFTAMGEAFRAAAREKLILVVDSTTGFYNELMDSYRAVVGRDVLGMEDMGVINRQWAEAMEDYKNGAFHAIIAGRRGWEWGHFENEATGRRELERVDVKFKGGGDTGYEPSLLIHMKRQTDASDAARPRIFRVATVIKDRAQKIDGASFENPTYQDFRPHFLALDLGGTHRGADGGDSRHLIADPRTGRRTWEERQCTLDEIDALLGRFIPGQDANAKRERADALQRNFGTMSKERLATLHLEVLRRGYAALHVQLTGVPPLVPTGRPDWTPPAAPVANHPATVAMVTGPNGELMTVEAAGKMKDSTAAGSGAALASSSAPHKPTGDQPGTAPLQSVAGVEETAPATETPGTAAPAKRKPGRPRKNATPTTPADAPAPETPPAPVETPAAPPAAENTDNPPAADGEAEKPAPGSTNPDSVLADATAPAEPAPPVKRKPGRPRKDATATPAADNGAVPAVADTAAVPPTPETGAKRRGRPPGSKNRPKGVEGAPVSENAAAAPATPAAGTVEPPAAPPTQPASGTETETHTETASVAAGEISPDQIRAWGDFMAHAMPAAAKHSITAPQFARGLTTTLARNRLTGVKREALPVEFLQDFFAAIQDGRWNIETGIFNAPAMA